MKNIFRLFLFFYVAFSFHGYGQGLNHNFLIGYTNGLDTNVISNKAILSFTSNNLVVSTDTFPMIFNGAQANISDENGNLLMYTNGCWIADATGNIMQGGDSLNPGLFASSWCNGFGMPLPNTSVFLPWPGDSSKYILLHQTSTDSDPTISSELFYTTIDLNLNNGLGGVIQKNQIALSGVLCPSIACSKHANGRDWWIVLMSPTNDIIYKLLLTPNGIIDSTSQSTGLPLPNNYYGQTQFSPDGNKFAYYNRYDVLGIINHQLKLLDFDRCTGLFSNPRTVTNNSTSGGYCMAFSPNSKYVYYGTFRTLFQVNTDTSNVAASLDTVGIQDLYCYPYSSNCTNFFYGYLAANGKIYIGSGGTTIDFHIINQPDNEGILCDMQLHNLRLPCRVTRSNVYHPNYYLGPEIGSACDTLAHVGIYELEGVKNLVVRPNPSYNGNFSVSYLLPQNQSGSLTIHDYLGRDVYQMKLPQWSSLQNLNLPQLNSGVYTLSIESLNTKSTKRIVIIR